MKTKTCITIIGLIISSIIFYSCNPLNQSNYSKEAISQEIITTKLFPTSTLVTKTSEVTPTSKLEGRFNDVPVFKEISCVPVENPFKMDSNSDKYLYEVMLLPNIEITRKCSFSGHVSRGEVFIHQINKNLIFCLVPEDGFWDVPDEGWGIVITDSRSKTCGMMYDGFDNFGPIVTPPYRGNMYFDVLGWHFRNNNNSGPNNGTVNAPQKEREFNFVFSEQDYKKIWYSMRCAEWNFPEDCNSATQFPINRSSTIFHSRARFIINNLSLGNLVTDSHAWIEEMDFTVEVYLPDED